MRSLDLTITRGQHQATSHSPLLTLLSSLLLLSILLILSGAAARSAVGSTGGFVVT